MHSQPRTPSGHAAGSALSLLRSPRSTANTPQSSAPLAIVPRQRIVPYALPKAATDERKYCSFDVGARCKYALATRECYDCKRWDRTGTGYHCEQCFAARHPWTGVPHRYTMLHQRPRTPPAHRVLNAVGERTVLETQKLLNSTLKADAGLGGSLHSAKPELLSAANKCNELVSRLTTSLLRLRDPVYQHRHLCANRIILAWRGRAWRQWWRAATYMLWGKMRDPVSRDYFFVNVVSLKTSWDPPVIFGRQVTAQSVRLIFPCTISKPAGAVLIQRVWRGFAARKALAESDFGHYWRRVLVDPARPPPRGVRLPKGWGSGDPLPPYYYYNILPPPHPHWQPPRFGKPVVLRSPTFEPYVYGEHPADADRCLLAVAAQKVARKFRVRLAFRRQVSKVFCRIWDGDFKRYFYYNKRSGKSAWIKPMKSLLRHWEPPILPGYEAPPGADVSAAASGKGSKRGGGSGSGSGSGGGTMGAGGGGGGEGEKEKVGGEGGKGKEGKVSGSGSGSGSGKKGRSSSRSRGEKTATTATAASTTTTTTAAAAAATKTEGDTGASKPTTTSSSFFSWFKGGKKPTTESSRQVTEEVGPHRPKEPPPLSSSKRSISSRKAHPLCKAEVDTLVKCHEENPYVKFFGVCNEAKSLMDLCFREEKNLRKKLNKKVPTNLPSVFMNPSSGGGSDGKKVE